MRTHFHIRIMSAQKLSLKPTPLIWHLYVETDHKMFLNKLIKPGPLSMEPNYSSVYQLQRQCSMPDFICISYLRMECMVVDNSIADFSRCIARLIKKSASRFIIIKMSPFEIIHIFYSVYDKNTYLSFYSSSSSSSLLSSLS